MRDPQRIPRVMVLLLSYWRDHPDLRLGQIVSNMASSGLHQIDPFYVEDEVIEKNLNEELRKSARDEI